MAISYNKLWKLLIDKTMKRKDLKEQAEISQNVMTRLSKNQAVSMESLEKICEVLNCDIGDIVEFVRIPTEKNVTGEFNDGRI